MVLDVEVIKEFSEDPYFKVRFFCKDGNCIIAKGNAEVLREFPKATIKINSQNTEKIDFNIEKLELEILNAVLEYIFKYGVHKSSSGKIIYCN